MATWSNINYNSILVDRRNDAEFYRPEYIDLLTNVRKVGSIQLRKLPVEVVSGPFGSTLTSSEYTSTGIPFIRISDLDSFFINKDNLVFISETANQKIKSSELSQGDLILSKVGNSIGIVSMLDDDFLKANISENNIGIRFKYGVDPKLKCCLLVYLNSLYGQSEILRRKSGNAQPKLNISDIYQIEVPIFPDDFQNIIFDIISEINEVIKTSKALYNQAQHLLESELGLDKLKFRKPVGYTARFSELEQSRRADAEFFHTKYDPFMSTVKDYQGGWSSLSFVTNRLLPNFNARRRAEYYDYIEIGDINISDGEYISSRLPALQLPANAKILLSGGEILISQVRPTRGAIAIVEDSLPHPTVCSGAFYVCTAKDPNQREAIWLYLRVIRAVFEKFCGGTSYPTVESNYLAKFPVPIFNKKIAQKIQDLVLQSKDASKESQGLLSQAKARVEQLIEETVAR